MTNGKTDKKDSKLQTRANLDDGFISFLRMHGISGDDVLAILTEFGINSLYDLKMTKEDPDILGQLKNKLQGRPLVVRALDKLAVETIDNATFYSEHAGAEEEAQTLADFLATHDVMADGDGSREDKLLSLLRTGGVTSLEGLKRVKEKGQNDPKLKALTAKITRLGAEAGSNFESITAAMVAVALRGGGSEVGQDLKDFIAKKGLPAGTDKELAEFGITTLEQLKAAKQDKAPGGTLDQLKTKLDNSGIRLAGKQIDDIKVSEIEQQIAEANSPEAQEAKQKSAELAAAITKVEELRQRVEKAVAADFTSVQKEVENQYNAVLSKIKDVSGADFQSASVAAVTSRDDLTKLLSTAIANVTQTKEILDGVEKAAQPLAKIIREQEILCGFLISPIGAIRKVLELVKLPEGPEQMVKGPGEIEDFSLTYKGRETSSFAASVADQASKTLAAAAQSSGALFAGTGVAAVSAAANYADSQKQSTESQYFDSKTDAECGEIRYIYAPCKALQFVKGESQLSDAASQRLGAIAKLQSADQQADAIMAFYEEYGSHFFLRCFLGGRYKFTAKGTSHSDSAKRLLIKAVAKTTDWAASASGSYAGLGGAVMAAASVKGEESAASARGDRFARDFENAEVVVRTAVLGGAGLAPRDVWAQSLRYNSTWAVIDRDQPTGVWDLVRRDNSLTDDIKSLAPALETVWVQQVFLKAVERTHPALYKYLKADPAISTAKALDDAVERFKGRAVQSTNLEPEVNVVVEMATSGSAEWPKVTAGLNEEGLKLIGGGAIVDYGQGAGSLLIGSYPHGNSWVASAKSHEHSCLATVTAYAIYLSDPDDLWDVKMVGPVVSEGKSKLPEVTAQLPAGYALTGGGAKVDFGGAGIMLTACCPELIEGKYSAWKAQGKDHFQEDWGNATAWVFGIKAKNRAETTPSKIAMIGPAQGSILPTLERAAKSSEEVIVGGGAAVTKWSAGGMLTCCGLSSGQGSPQKWKAQAKDHFHYDDSLELMMWIISRKGTLGKVSE